MYAQVHWFERVDNYIVFVKNRNDVERATHFLFQTHSWNPHANFLVYINSLHTESGQIKLIEFILSKFWTKKVTDIIVVTPREDHKMQKNKVTKYNYNNCLFL